MLAAMGSALAARLKLNRPTPYTGAARSTPLPSTAANHRAVIFLPIPKFS